MSFLTLNGVPITIIDWNRNPDDIGGNARAYQGGMMSARRARKRGWQITTYPLPQGEAEAVEALACALGETWSFDLDAYSGKGRAFNLPAGASISASQSKYGGSSLELPGGSETIIATSAHIPLAPSQPHTLMAWAYSALTSGAAHLDIREYDSSDTLLFTHSALTPTNDSAWHYLTGTFTANASAAYAVIRAYIDGSSAGNAYIDDLVWLPAALTSSMLSTIGALGEAFTPPPNVRLEGDIVGNETITCRGALNASRGAHYGDSLGAQDGEILTITLEEE